MSHIDAYPVMDFSGGIRRDKSLFELQKNELLDARNVEIDDKGRIRIRRGSQQLGQTLTGTIENSFLQLSAPDGSAPAVIFYVNNNASTGVLSLLRGARLTTALTTASTTLVVDATIGTGNFAASGTVEVEGDLIAYTSKNADGRTFDGVTGVTSAHAVGAGVHQWATVSQGAGTAVDARMGVYYASINGIVIFAGRLVNMKQIDASGVVTDVTGEPAVLFLTNYHRRLFAVGDGSAALNGSPIRLSWSALDDGTSWATTSDFRDVPDQNGEYIMALKVLNDQLGIFKTNSIFTFDQIDLKQQVFSVGAYNQKVVQEINGHIFTFCPNGIFETNLFSAKQIGLPVKEFWENFQPVYDTVGLQRVCTNTWAASFEDKYFLYISNITSPTVTNDVVLEYNTTTKSWTVYDGGFTNFVHLNGLNEFRFGDRALNSRSALFGGDSGGKVWRLFENKYTDLTPAKQGGDIFQDLISDTGSPVSASFETSLYDMTHPELFKKIKGVRMFAEQGQWNVEYRVENEQGITQYRPLGVVNKTNQFLPFPKEASGFRHGFRISGVNSASASIFNGLIFEDIELTSRQ